MNQIQIIRKETTHLNRWSGGTTRELFIFPETATYAARNFLFRLSIATIEVDTSDFTPLEGVRRVTLILDGSIKLHHKGHYSKTIHPFESDSYDGGWESRSEGQCTDFNLMLRENVQGTVKVHSVMNGDNVDLGDATKMRIMYVHSGSVSIDGMLLNAGDAVVVPQAIAQEKIRSNDTSILICCEIEGI